MIRGSVFALGIVLIAFAPDPARAAAPTVTSFNPATGGIGTKVTIIGSGFTGATSVTLDGKAASFTVSSATQISANVPATAAGKFAITTSGATGTSASAFTVTPGLQLSPTIGHESIVVTVTGAGFAPYTAVDVYFDATDEALAASNSLGVVSIPVTISAIAQPGGHWITLVAR
jgi:hypothetical protein